MRKGRKIISGSERGGGDSGERVRERKAARLFFKTLDAGLRVRVIQYSTDTCLACNSAKGGYALQSEWVLIKNAH